MANGFQRIEALRTLLAAHVPACDEEAAHLKRMMDLLDVPGDPFSRDHYEPGHFTASGFVLSPDGRSVLLVLHRKLNRWLQPGGHIDPEDADLFSAACREVSEETGLIRLRADQDAPIIFDVDIHPIPAHKTEPAHAHFDVRFLLQCETTEVTRSDESHDAAWVSLNELSVRMIDPCEARVIRKLSGPGPGQTDGW